VLKETKLTSKASLSAVFEEWERFHANLYGEYQLWLEHISIADNALMCRGGRRKLSVFFNWYQLTSLRKLSLTGIIFFRHVGFCYFRLAQFDLISSEHLN
jgi:hypothetical protein